MVRPLHRTLGVPAPFAALLVLAVAGSPLGAQAGVREGTIDPGMTRAQVEERLGAPKVVRTAGAATYLFYANGCARSCGMDDLVVLEQDAVTDAVFRSPAHRYSGTSSSPAALTPAAARGGRPRGTVSEVRVESDGAAPAPAGGIVIGGAAPAADSAVPASKVARRRARRSRPRTRANVANQGVPLHPRATRAPTPSAPRDSSAARVPFQGAHLAPADSDLRALRRAVTIPGQSGAAPARPATRPDASPPDTTRH